MEIILTDDRYLSAAVNDFEIPRVEATLWARAYFQKGGEAFVFADYDETQRAAWEGMKAARRRLIATAQQRAAADSRWPIGLIVPCRRTLRIEAAPVEPQNTSTQSPSDPDH